MYLFNLRINEENQKLARDFVFNLSNTGILDTICFSEVLDSLDNKIKVGNIVQVYYIFNK